MQTFQVKYFVLFDKCAAINVAKHEGKVLAWLFVWRNKFLWHQTADQHSFDSWFWYSLYFPVLEDSRFFYSRRLYSLDSWSSILARQECFASPPCPERFWEPTQPPVQRLPVVKQSQRIAYHSPLSSSVAYTEWNFTSRPVYTEATLPFKNKEIKKHENGKVMKLWVLTLPIHWYFLTAFY